MDPSAWEQCFKIWMWGGREEEILDRRYKNRLQLLCVLAHCCSVCVAIADKKMTVCCLYGGNQVTAGGATMIFIVKHPWVCLQMDRHNISNLICSKDFVPVLDQHSNTRLRDRCVTQSGRLLSLVQWKKTCGTFWLWVNANENPVLQHQVRVRIARKYPRSLDLRIWLPVIGFVGVSNVCHNLSEDQNKVCVKWSESSRAWIQERGWESHVWLRERDISLLWTHSGDNNLTNIICISSNISPNIKFQLYFSVLPSPSLFRASTWFSVTLVLALMEISSAVCAGEKSQHGM